MTDWLSVLVDVVDHALHERVLCATLLVEGDDCLLWAIEHQALALGARTNLRDIIKTEHHIL